MKTSTRFPQNALCLTKCLNCLLPLPACRCSSKRGSQKIRRACLFLKIWVLLRLEACRWPDSVSSHLRCDDRNDASSHTSKFQRRTEQVAMFPVLALRLMARGLNWKRSVVKRHRQWMPLLCQNQSYSMEMKDAWAFVSFHIWCSFFLKERFIPFSCDICLLLLVYFVAVVIWPNSLIFFCEVWIKHLKHSVMQMQSCSFISHKPHSRQWHWNGLCDVNIALL